MVGGPRLWIQVADSQPLFREAIVAGFDAEPDIEVVGTAADGVQAMHEAERLRPDVAVVEVELPNCDGVRAAAQIRERVRGCRVLILADQEDEAVLLRSVEAGASGFLSKADPLSEVKEAARALDRG